MSLIPRPYLPRFLALKFNPPLHNISHSSAVLSALTSSFGPLDSFRNLRYDLRSPRPGVVLAVFRDQLAAQRVVDASPLRCKLVEEGEEQWRCEFPGHHPVGSGRQDVQWNGEGEVSFPQAERRMEGRVDGDGVEGEGKPGAKAALMAILDGFYAEEADGRRYSRRGDGIASTSTGIDGSAGQTTTGPVRKYSTSRALAMEDSRTADRRPRTLRFTLFAEPARVDLAAAAKKHPCHGPFDVHARTSIARSVGSKAPLRGLEDLSLRRDRRSWKDVGRAAKRVPGKIHEGGLQGLWEEGRRLRGEEES